MEPLTQFVIKMLSGVVATGALEYLWLVLADRGRNPIGDHSKSRGYANAVFVSIRYAFCEAIIWPGILILF
jgi:hypothetical protein